MSLKWWCPHFCIFFLLPATLLSTRRRPTMSSSLPNGIWRKSAYILILKCCLPAKALQHNWPSSTMLAFAAQLCTGMMWCLNNSQILTSFFLFDAPLSPHSFPQLGQCFRIEIRTMPFMPIFAASIDTGNCMGFFFGIRKPDRNPTSYVRTLTLVLVLYEKLQTHRNGIVSSIQRRRRKRKNALLAKWRPLRQMPPRATSVNFLLQLSSFITK